jgi:hypothetical protein
MEDLINIWSAELEDHVAAFSRQAREVGHWDKIVRENLDKVKKK